MFVYPSCVSLVLPTTSWTPFIIIHWWRWDQDSPSPLLWRWPCPFFSLDPLSRGASSTLGVNSLFRSGAVGRFSFTPFVYRPGVIGERDPEDGHRSDRLGWLRGFRSLGLLGHEFSRRTTRLVSPFLLTSLVFSKSCK